MDEPAVVDALDGLEASTGGVAAGGCRAGGALTKSGMFSAPTACDGPPGAL